jgi:hypothetical protein
MLARSSKAIICSPYIPSDKSPLRTRRTLVHPRRRLVLCSRGCIHALHRPPGGYTFDWSWLGSGANRLLPGPGTSSRRQRPARAPPCRTGASTSLAGNHTGSPWQGIRHSRAPCPHGDGQKRQPFLYGYRAKPRRRRFAPATCSGLPTPTSGCQPTFDRAIDALATIPGEQGSAGARPVTRFQGRPVLHPPRGRVDPAKFGRPRRLKRRSVGVARRFVSGIASRSGGWRSEIWYRDRGRQAAYPLHHDRPRHGVISRRRDLSP